MSIWQKVKVLSLGQEDPLEKEIATHSRVLAWEIPQRNLVGYSPWGHKRVGHDLGMKNKQQNGWYYTSFFSLPILLR